MAPDDKPDAPQSEDDARTERDKEFSRRQLLRAGSAVPLMGTAGFLAACGSSHNDAHGDHTDAPHNDANHTDTHSDGSSHSDSSGHNDSGGSHGDKSTHSDKGTHSDNSTHSDKPTHSDKAPHSDLGTHNDVTIPGQHTDVHGDSPGDNSHTDMTSPPQHGDSPG